MARRLTRFVLICIVLGLTSGMATRAQAGPITGSVSFGGNIASMDFLTGNAIDVVGNQAAVTCAILGVCTGTYAPVKATALGPAIVATYNDFTFEPFPSGGYPSLWSFTFEGLTYSFDLLTRATLDRAATGIIITGTGMAYVTGFDPTPAYWSFSADNTGLYAFSSTTAADAPPIPEPATISLVAVGIAAGLIRRRRTRA